MMMDLSRARLIIAVETIVIVFMGYWMSQEYLNNVFLRQYVSAFWAANWLIAPAALIISGVIGGATYVVRSRRSDDVEEDEAVTRRTEHKLSSTQKQLVTTSGLVVSDTCPYCNVALRSIADDRFQCRKCRRYFKR